MSTLKPSIFAQVMKDLTVPKNLVMERENSEAIKALADKIAKLLNLNMALRNEQKAAKAPSIEAPAEVQTLRFR